MTHVKPVAYGLICFVVSTLTPLSSIYSEDYGPLLAELYCSVRELPPEESLRVLEQLPREEVAVVVHNAALERKSSFRHETGYVESLRRLALRLFEAEGSELRDSVVDDIEMRLRSVVFFDTHSGYVDSDLKETASERQPSGSGRYRGTRSIALRLESLRVLEQIALLKGSDAPFSQQELDKLVHDYNPTYVATSRSDQRLKSRSEWTIIERAQIALLASLLHFPEDREVVALLRETALQGRSATVQREGVLAAVFPLFVYRLMQATDVELSELRNWISIRPPRFALDKQVPEGEFYELAEILNSVFDDADMGSRRYFPEEHEQALNYEGRWRMASKARTEATTNAFYLLRQADVKRLRNGYEALHSRLRDATYVRSRWIGPRWNLPEDEKAAETELVGRLAPLAELADHWLRQLEGSVSSMETDPTFDHKAFLIAELLWLYDERSEGVRDPNYRASIDRLRRLIRDPNDDTTLCAEFQRNILAWEVYEHIRNPDTSVDILRHTRLMENPPKDIAEKAAARYEFSIDTLVALLDKHLQDRYRSDERLRLIAELGFPVSSIYKLEKSQREAIQGESKR